MPAADWFEVMDWIGPEKVEAADDGPIWVTMSVIVFDVDCGSANSPTSDTNAISAGKSASRP